MVNRRLRRLRKVLSYFRLQTPRDVLVVAHFAWLMLAAWWRNALFSRPRVACPCCGWQGHIFLPVYWVTLNVRNARCPRCYAEHRHRLVFRYLRERQGIMQGQPLRLLHVSPERGIQRALRGLPGMRYVACDLTADPLAATIDVRMDITALGFAAGVFDVILCNHVLEHIPDDRAAMRELRRTLRDGGYAVVMVPLMDMAQTIEYGRADPREWGHVRRYGRDYVDRLAAAGFAVTIDPYAYALPDDVVRREVLFREPLFIVRQGPQHPPGVVGNFPPDMPWKPDAHGG